MTDVSPVEPPLLTRRSVAELLDRHGLAPQRSRGQNFVVDPNTVRRIARLSGVGPGDPVVEIGPGLGSLTLALLATGARVTAVEIDHGLAAVVRDVVDDAARTIGDDDLAARFRLVEGDALTADWDDLAPDPVTVVANLPYNVATPLVADLLDDQPRVTRLLVMVQSEVADRLVAGPGSKAYGAVSVKVAYWAQASVVGRVGRDVFLPRPNVESALVDIVRRPQPAVAVEPAVLFEVVRTAFGHRRKMLRRSLADVVSESEIAAVGIDPTTRPEQLDLAAFGHLADAVARRRAAAS